MPACRMRSSSPRGATASMAQTIRPRTPVSHGCVRLSLPNATTLYDLVTAEGMGKTTVIVEGMILPVTIRRASRRSRAPICSLRGPIPLLTGCNS